MPLFRYDGSIIHFVHIPKTGGSSLENALVDCGAIMALHCAKKKKFSVVTPQHLHAKYYQTVLPVEFADWHFCVVRNPYQRMVSEYHMKVNKENGSATFDQFVSSSIKRCRQFRETRDNHIRPQCDFITSYIQVFSLEDGLEIPLALACQKLGLAAPKSVPHARKSHASVVEANRSTIDLISKFYRKDFTMFNYDPEVVPDSIKICSDYI